MRIKSKLLLCVSCVILFIMFCSTAAVYVLLNKQNRHAVTQNLEKTIAIVKDELEKRSRKQTRDTRQAVTSNKIGDDIKFISDFADQMNITTDSYIKITTVLAQLITTGELWQAAVYDRNGTVVSSIQAMDDQTWTTAYVYGSDQLTFAHARPPAGSSLKDADWQKSQTSPISTINDKLNITHLSETETVLYDEVGGYLCLRTSVPIYTNGYNRQTEQVEQQRYGTAVAWQRLGSSFTANIAKLSGM